MFFRSFVLLGGGMFFRSFVLLGGGMFFRSFVLLGGGMFIVQSEITVAPSVLVLQWRLPF